MEHRSFALDDPHALDAGLAGIATCMHCGAPFTATSRPMVEACLRRRAHYLDITGEIDVFEACAARDGEARSAGIMCYRAPASTWCPPTAWPRTSSAGSRRPPHLTLALPALGPALARTATTMSSSASRRAHPQGVVLTRVPPGWRTLSVDFGRGARPAISIPWGDVATAFYSTGIPNIEVYVAAPAGARLSLRLSRFLTPLLRSRAVKSYLKRRIRRGPPGPGPEARARGRTIIWGGVRDDAGGRAQSRLGGPEGYHVHRADRSRRSRAGDGRSRAAGFQTPSRAYGPDFVLQVPAAERVDL